ncbi:MAG: holo-[acyl-carrier-protein] synthase [Verrucomicrobiaceae bacterium]|jgi:holo-[acyl-carrier protein] synthase|nr:holo-ACP synthase [Verrucomicrobiales bacterium]MDB4526927.1 holo-ACP synthase [bacterium]NCF86308.1 holo-[acyl-carrier-protein] synthase [Verrucomicrobiaceae bacterium]MDC0503667.1 holo-ACP synthase [Verrucomicrobiales bacterium]MDF1785931.1 holo-ACP synthase [Verrucomicrobiales bacterium]
MAIYGIGTDLVEVSRIERSLTRHGDRFRDRIFTAREIAYCESLAAAAKFRSYAARFAAKEALSKAFHLGIGPGFDWVDLEINRNDAGAPSVALHHRAAELARHEHLGPIHISLSHTDSHAIAYAMIEA